MKAPSAKVETKRMLDFNSTYPVGTVCDYWTMDRNGDPSGTAKTRSSAELLGGHTAVVWLEGVSGCIALTHVRPKLFMQLSAQLRRRLHPHCPPVAPGETPT